MSTLTTSLAAIAASAAPGAAPLLPPLVTIVLGTLSTAAILAVPALAAVALLARWRNLDAPLALAAALAGAALFGWLTFVAGIFGLGFGYGASAVVQVVSVGAIFATRASAVFRRSAKTVLLAWGVAACVAIFVSSLGFAFGGADDPLATAAMRFSHHLPTDNQLPFMVAEGLQVGKMPRPLYIDWLSSDRPALQTGLYLATAGWWPGEGALHYQIVSVFAQCMSLIGVALFMIAARATRGAFLAALLGIALSGFFIVNAFFVWPKLLSVGFSLVPAAFALTNWPEGRREDLATPALVGVSAAFALLSHGAAIFGIFGIGLAMLLRIARGRIPFPSLKFIGVALACAALVYAPWMAYQKWVDPGGDRLMKYHLAGVQQLDPRPLGQMLTEEYARVGWDGALDNKLTNAGRAVTPPLKAIGNAAASLWYTVVGDSARARATAGVSRGDQFFFLFPALGLFALGPLLFAGYAAWQARPGARRLFNWAPEPGVEAWIACLLGTAVWVVSLFDGASAVLHASGYALFVLAVCGSCILASAWSDRLAMGVAAANALLTIVVYVFYTPFAASAFRTLAHQPQLAPVGIALIGLAGSAILAARLVRTDGLIDTIDKVAR